MSQFPHTEQWLSDTEENILSILSELPDEEQEKIDDMKELHHYEKRLRFALEAMDSYINDWQVRSRKMHRELAAIQRRREALEVELMLREKVKEKKEKVASIPILEKFEKILSNMAPSQVAAFRERITNNSITNNNS